MGAERQGVTGAPAVAFFDFDCTLTARDTLMPWLFALKGRRRTLWAAARVGVTHPLRADTGADDLRTRIKSALFARLLAGVSVEDALAAAARVGDGLLFRADMTRRVAEHLARGDRVVVATGSPTLVAGPIVAARFGLREVIGTELEVADGRLTGRLAGPNCTRYAKAALVGAWLAQNAAGAVCHGYGNRPHDLPMLALMDHATVV
jgi:HAD superfamily hydrolase (TIGR01490 family)